MTAASNNENNPLRPKDRDDTGSFRMWVGEGRKSLWFQVHGFLGGSIDNGNVFRKHSERMIRFRKSINLFIMLS